MATLFMLDEAGTVIPRSCPDDRPLLLGDDLRKPRGGDMLAGWKAAIVSFAVTPRAPRGWAIVVAPGASVAVGATTVRAGVVELHDRDRVLLGERETMFSTDALPEPVEPGTPRQPCPVCCDATDDGVFRCPRCATRACRRCWDLAPRRECLTPGCHQPASFDRSLWEPALSEFVTWDGEEVR